LDAASQRLVCMTGSQKAHVGQASLGRGMQLGHALPVRNPVRQNVNRSDGDDPEGDAKETKTAFLVATGAARGRAPPSSGRVTASLVVFAEPLGVDTRANPAKAQVGVDECRTALSALPQTVRTRRCVS